MSSPTDEEVRRYIEEIVKGVTSIEKKLESDVRDMCTLLLLLLGDCKERVRNRDVPQRLKESFKDIYGCLKLHLKFHLGAVEVRELNTLGQQIGLTVEELDALPGKECAIDPGSKLLEILSDIAECSDGPKGSESHANAVMTQAKDWLSRLGQKNTFKPKVLVRVSRNGEWFVGSSVAVSHFLRPLCLYNRICDFKQSLKKAVIYFQPLETSEDKVLWNSSAFWFKAGYKTEKPPCQNCRFMFKNLSGFSGGTDNLGQEGASANTVGGTFLAACGEYPPINQCLPANDAESSLEDKPDNKAVYDALRRFRNNCTLFFENFEKIASKCFRAYESKDVKRLKNVYHTHVKRRIHIFGIKPECNGSLKIHDV